MTRGYFVTGTDTGVGKTTFCVGLLRAAFRRGLAVAALKPVETGSGPDASDASRLAAAAGRAVPVPFRYAPPVAPAVAARLAGRPVSLAVVLAARDELLTTRPDLLLVEGAGGLLVPYGDALLGDALVRALGFPLLIVARTSLGTINHTLLTLAAARQAGLVVAGVVLNQVAAPVAGDVSSCRAEIEHHGGVVVLGTVPHLAASVRDDPDALADAVEAGVAVGPLLGP